MPPTQRAAPPVHFLCFAVLAISPSSPSYAHSFRLNPRSTPAPTNHKHCTMPFAHTCLSPRTETSKPAGKTARMREAQKEAEDEIGALRAERMAAYEQERDKVRTMLLGAHLGLTSDMRTRVCSHTRVHA